ncbi:hypothetical protein K469DRAFT_709503, partial [Zopfia rhizophila CBS 207.26]
KLRRLEKQARDKSIPITIKKRTKDGQTLSTDIATWVEMDPTEITDELHEQILYIKALEQQTDTLFRIANDALHAESETTEALRPSKVETQAEKAALETPSQSAKQRQTRQNARFPSLRGRSSPALLRTPGAATQQELTTPGSRSAKFPDPPILDDSVNPTFKNWNKQMRNKLRLNADWYDCDDPDATEAARIAYIQTHVTGKASDFLNPFLDAREDRGEEVAVEEVIQYLQSVFKDPDQRIKA